MSGSPEGIYEPGIVDPGIPNPNPTQAFWQSQPHPLANHQSPWPTEIVDVVIIGSGVTGTNLARNLLKESPDLRVVIVEARTLCSGATGRNGGHIKTMAFAPWQERKQIYGIDEAIRLTEFEHSHLATMTDAARENGIDREAVLCEGLDVYFDQTLFEKALADLEDMRLHAPHLADQYTIYTNRHQLEKVFKLSNRCVGAFGVPAASIWPYKLITGLISPLIKSGKLNVQTNTSVKSITDSPKDDFAVVHTNRGNVKARNVVHATNAWMGHLIPELRPYVSPVRGNVVHYMPLKNEKATSTFGFDSEYSYWLRYTQHDYDYLIQRREGDVIVGRANTARRATGDDSETDMSPMSHLRGMARQVSAQPSDTVNISHAWSGILGFSQDKSPFVGRLPFPGRSHQWVCGAYHGIGMTKAFRTAEMMALLLLGKEVPEEYPRSMLITSERMRALRRSLGYDEISAQPKL